MASRYYNPRLAQSVGAAESTPYVSLTPAIERGQIAFERGRARSLKRQALELERKKLEAEAYNKKLKELDDTLIAINKQKKDSKAGIDGLPASAKGFITMSSQLAVDNYNKIQQDVKSGRISKADAVLRVDKEVNSIIDRNNYIIDNYNELIDSANLLEPSSINSSADLDIAKKQISGEYILNYDPNTDQLIAEFQNDEGEIIKSIPLNEMNKPAYKVVNTEAFSTAIGTINDIADKAAKAGKSQKSFENELSASIDGLNFTPDEVMSIAFDYLAKEKPEFANLKDYEGKIGEWVQTIDTDGDGVPGEDEDLAAWAKNQLKTIGNNAYSGYQKDYATTDDIDDFKLTSTQRLQKQKVEENLEFAKETLQNFYIPKNTIGFIDFDDPMFTRELSKLNIFPDPRGPIKTPGTEVQTIELISNFTNDKLLVTSDMSGNELKRVIMQLSGASAAEAKKAYPTEQLPLNFDQYIKQQ